MQLTSTQKQELQNQYEAHILKKDNQIEILRNSIAVIKTNISQSTNNKYINKIKDGKH